MHGLGYELEFVVVLSTRSPALTQCLNLHRWLDENKSGVLACSTLKQVYRGTLTAGLDGDVTFVYLKVGSYFITAGVVILRESNHS